MNLLLACLLLGPPNAPPPERPLPPSQRASNYEQARGELEQAVDAARERLNQQSRAMLTAKLGALRRFGLTLAFDARGLELRDTAMLLITASYLAEADDIAASRAMDDFIRTLGGRNVDIRVFGDPVVDLFASRLNALETTGAATIHSDCETCVLVINETPLTATRQRLYLGSYRVWLVSDRLNLAREITLDTAGEVVFIDLPEDAPPPEPEPCPAPALVDPPLELPEPVEPERLMHVGASTAGMLVSLGLVVGGTALVALKQNCLGTGDCPKDFSLPIGGTVLGIGAAGFGAFLTTLIIDESRAARAARGAP